ncbi:MAG: hypothetical protein CM15mP46_4920 [Alphaproteobacteria bacterium]|nr:MAG: hypothetical protein CM15mP46_4920 [Alphaproteobacteria bacterium]
MHYGNWLDFSGLVRGLGRGRALSVGEVKFTDKFCQENKRVQFRLDMKRVIMRRLVMGIADGKVLCDGEVYLKPMTFALVCLRQKEINHYASCCNHWNRHRFVDWK